MIITIVVINSFPFSVYAKININYYFQTIYVPSQLTQIFKINLSFFHSLNVFFTEILFQIPQARMEYHHHLFLNVWVWFLTGIAITTILAVNFIYIKNSFFLRNIDIVKVQDDSHIMITVQTHSDDKCECILIYLILLYGRKETRYTIHVIKELIYDN